MAAYMIHSDVKVPPAPVETKQKRLLRPSELPIYDVHRCHKCAKAEAEQQQQQQKPVSVGFLNRFNVTSMLELQIVRARSSVVGSLDVLADTKDRAIVFYQTGKAHTLDTVAYLREESNILPRVGAISTGGLFGLLLAARRGFFKKLIYGSAGTAAIASVCYPDDARQVSNKAYTISKYYAYVAYQKMEDEVSTRTATWPSSPASAAGAEISKMVDKLINRKDGTIGTAKGKKVDPAAAAAGDFGQSNPQDADLYTTRGS